MDLNSWIYILIMDSTDDDKNQFIFKVTEVLTAMDIGEFEIRVSLITRDSYNFNFNQVNHRSLLKGIFSDCGIPSDSFKTVCSSIDKLDKQPWCEIRKELIDDKGIESEAVDKLNWFMELKGWLNSHKYSLIQSKNFQKKTPTGQTLIYSIT